MKLTTKTRPWLTRLLVLGAIAGTLFWALLEALLLHFGYSLNLNIGPLGFDLYIVSLNILVNPGTILGLVFSWILFWRMP